MAHALFDSVRKADLDGVTLAYVEQGEGEAVVFVHGAISDLRTWEHQLPAISESHRTITYSRRYARPNVGLGDGAGDPWQRHVDDLAEFLLCIDASPAHLVGNSSGAFISLLLGVQRPELVRSLTLEEPPVISLFVSTPPRILELLSLFVSHPRTAMGIAQFGAGTIAKTVKALERGDNELAVQTFARGVLGNNQGLSDLPEVRQQQVRENFKPLGEFFLSGEPFPPITVSDLERLPMPVLLLAGERSPSWLIRLIDRLEEAIPNALRVNIKDAGHLIHEDNPQAINEAFLNFVAKPSHV